MTTTRLYQISYLPTDKSRKPCTKEIFATGPIQAKSFLRRLLLPLSMPFAELQRKKTFKILAITEIPYEWAES
jgi:hypothetical protein